MKTCIRTIILVLAISAAALAQSARLYSSGSTSFPALVTDGNSPAFWLSDTLRVYTSSGMPEAMSGADLLRLQRDDAPIVDPSDHYPLWIEGVWQDEDGTVYAWYHHEADGGCAYKGLMTPQIGALVSSDGGKTFHDLGIVLSSGAVPNCGAENGFFAGGHGDFSVILDGAGEYFYFLFTNYGGAAATQGVAMARMAFKDRGDPVGAVYKYYQGDWSEPGVGGTMTPILPATVSWDRADTSSFWGPAVHWNTYLERYVVFLNRACCKPRWPQEGVYVTFASNLSDPDTWTEPAKLPFDKKTGFVPAYYPQVFGTGPGETDTLVGEVGRFFLQGVSKWEIVFSKASDGQPGLDFDEPPVGRGELPLDLEPVQ